MPLEGSRVVLAARTAATLAAAKNLPDISAALLTKICDATDRAQVADLVAWTAANAGPIDILVYSAGVNVPRRTFADIDPADFDRVTATNATGAFNCMHAVLPAIRARKTGPIINVVSLAEDKKGANFAFCNHLEWRVKGTGVRAAGADLSPKSRRNAGSQNGDTP